MYRGEIERKMIVYIMSRCVMCVGSTVLGCGARICIILYHLKAPAAKSLHHYETRRDKKMKMKRTEMDGWMDGLGERCMCMCV